MRTFLSTQTNDLALNMGKSMEVISSIEGIAQTARQYMQTRRNEMIHDMPEGIPFDITVWQGTPNLAQFEASARRRLRQVPGIRDILSFEATMSGDTLQYVAVLQTDLGEVSING